MYAFGQKERFLIFVLVQTRVNFLNELQESTKRVLPRAHSIGHFTHLREG